MNRPALPSPPRRGARLVLALLLVAGITIGFLRAPGTSDVIHLVVLVKTLDPYGPFAGYSHILDNYPPLSLFMMWLSIHLGDAIGIPELVSFKAPVVLFGIVASALVLARTRSPAAAVLLFLAVAPFGLMYGYYDIVYLPFFLLALDAAEGRNWGLAGASLAVAALIKWQPVLLIPVFVIGALRQMKSLRQAAMTALPALLVVAVIAGAFGPGAVFAAFRRATWDSYLSGQGMNVGWIVSYGLEVLNVGALRLQPDGAVAVLIRSPDAPAIAVATSVIRGLFYLFFAASIGIYVAGRPTRQAFMLTALACGMAQFTWNSAVHENHLFVPMVIAFVAWNAKFLDGFLFLALAALAILDVVMFGGFDGGSAFSRVAGIDATVVLAAAELLLFALLLDLQVRACLGRAPAAVTEPAS